MRPDDTEPSRDRGRLRLERPLAFFDLETTGVDPDRDRIVEIAVVRIDPDGSRHTRCRRVDPERPIPAEATAVHGIRDEDVAGEPPFRKLARGIADFFGDADLAGFNVARFDVPLLDREFRDCGVEFDLENRRIVDAMTIFHRNEPRDLSAAVRFYLGRDHADAHAAIADVEATADILEAQLARYGDLPGTVDELDRWCNPAPPDAVDRTGKFRLRDGVVVFGFGKHEGRPLADVAKTDGDYVRWMTTSNFPPDAKRIAREALEGPSGGPSPRSGREGTRPGDAGAGSGADGPEPRRGPPRDLFS